MVLSSILGMGGAAEDSKSVEEEETALTPTQTPNKVFEAKSSPKNGDTDEEVPGAAKNLNTPSKMSITPASPGTPHSVQSSPGNKCCQRWMDIVAVSCLFLMSILFIAGSAIIHPKSDGDEGGNEYGSLDEPYAFYCVGTMFFVAYAILDLLKRVRKGVLEIVNGSIEVLAGTFWFIGSILLFPDTLDVKAWAALTLLGSLANLYVITCDLVLIYRRPIQPFFKTMALKAVWFANLFFLGGCSSWLAYTDESMIQTIYGREYYLGATCIANNAANVMISGSVLYLFHSILQVLAIWCFPRLIFTMKVSTV